MPKCDCGRFISKDKKRCNKCIEQEVASDLDDIERYITGFYPNYPYEITCEDVRFVLQQYFYEYLMSRNYNEL